MSPSAEKGCPYCHAEAGEVCKPGCITGPGVYVAQSADVARGRTEAMVPHSVMVSQIRADVERCARIVETFPFDYEKHPNKAASYRIDADKTRKLWAAKIRSGE